MPVQFFHMPARRKKLTQSPSPVTNIAHKHIHTFQHFRCKLSFLLPPTCPPRLPSRPRLTPSRPRLPSVTPRLPNSSRAMLPRKRRSASPRRSATPALLRSPSVATCNSARTSAPRLALMPSSRPPTWARCGSSCLTPTRPSTSRQTRLRPSPSSHLVRSRRTSSSAPRSVRPTRAKRS